MEKDIEKRLVDGVKAMGGLCLKWVSPGQIGVPDRIVLLPKGRVIFVELKTDSGRLSVMQDKMASEISARGHTVRVLYGNDGVDQFLKKERARWNSSHSTTKSL